ncbi:MAG: protein kinase [Planctomycetaceae bacterium]|nr:protein kinase [Planctomycetaceae bacterium]
MKQSILTTEEPTPGRVELAIEEFLMKRGILDIDEWLSRYPDCTPDLLEFLQNESSISSVTTALCGAPGPVDCRIGEYEILEVVDRGGMGVVYKARQRRLRRIVALKMIHQGQFQSPEVRRRFQNEAETVARLRHPNLVTIHEIGEHNGVPFFSMEYVRGRTLSDLNRQGRINPRAIAQIACSIADTIHYIHGCGILHRDLKPSNIMIDDDKGEVRVTDFGLAKQLDRGYSMTETGQILGSIDYMPPEQAEARHEQMGPASDVYSIGAIMYELLTGRPPFQSDTFLATLRMIREQKPVPPRELNSRVPEELEAICLKCLRKKPSARYASASELAQDLSKFLDKEPVDVLKWQRRRQKLKPFAGALSVMMAAVCVLAVILSTELGSSEEPPLFTSPEPPKHAADDVEVKLPEKTDQESAAGVAQAEAEGDRNDRNEKVIQPVSVQTPVPNVPAPLPDVAATSKPPAPANPSEQSPVVANPPASPVPPPVIPVAQAETPAAPVAPVPQEPVAAKPLDVAANDQVVEAVAKADVQRPELPAPVPAPAPPVDDTHRQTVITTAMVSGQPFGVASVELEIRPETGWEYRDDVPIRFMSRDGKPLYGAFQYRKPTAASRHFPGRPARLTGWFLFAGDAPPVVNIVAADDVLARDVQVAVDPKKSHRSLLSAWWAAFSRNNASSASPELAKVNDYFREMMARRLSLPPNRRTQSTSANSSLEHEFERTFGMLFGFESIRLAMMADRIQPAEAPSEFADLGLPEPLSISSVRVPDRTDDVSIEWIAKQIPAECFYLRCFRIANYSWVRSLVKGWGGDLEGVVANPAVDFHVRDRIESQLALDVDSLVSAGADDEISDCALIGLDPFFHDGAALGVLFEAKSAGRLGEILEEERAKVARLKNLTETTVQIEGRSVRLLTTNHFEIRSWYVVKDGYHLITNSKALVQRFLQTSQSSSLGALAEYRYARSKMDTDGKCVSWLYLPDPFFRNITSPKYRVELHRRRRAADDLIALQLARMACEAETGAVMGVPELIQNGFLPLDFGTRPDNSSATVSDGIVCDSHRGVHGTFLPIADMPVVTCTSYERNAYEAFRDAYTKEWRTMDPVLLSFYRRPPEGDIERIVLNIRITPYAQQEYEFLRRHLASAPDQKKIVVREKELMGVSASLRGQHGFQAHAHAGLKDEEIPYEIYQGSIRRTGRNKSRSFASSNSYALITDKTDAGAFLLPDFVHCLKTRESLMDEKPPETLLEQMLFAVIPYRDIVRSGIESYRRTSSRGCALAADKEIGHAVLDDFSFEKADRPAHLFMHMKDVSQSIVFPYIRAWTYSSSRKVSGADVASLNRTADLLQMEPNAVRIRIEEAIQGRLVCPAGGQYEPVAATNRPPFLRSSMWLKPSVFDESTVPENYSFPFFDWLHGFQMETQLNAVTLESRLELRVKASDEGDIWPIPELASTRR